MLSNSTQQEDHHKLSTALRILAIEMVEEAKSGHPGMPMGFADVATVLFRYFIKFNPKDASWPNRDRFVLSAGHGSALLYGLLHLLGYEQYTIEELKRFRQFGSITPGHPEYDHNLGVETTTGPLGQGMATAVGMAISERKLSQQLGTAIDHKIYVVVGDGCLMEGITHETMSLAGHLGLNNLIVLFDDNKISIDGPTSLAISDMTLARVASYNWNVMSVDGHNPDAIYNALKVAQETEKPIFIACKTKIGYGSPHFENSEESHGKNLGDTEIALVKKVFCWDYPKFSTPSAVLELWRSFFKRNLPEYDNWQRKYGKVYREFIARTSDVSDALGAIKAAKTLQIGSMEATRKSSQGILEVITPITPALIGGSADLSGSNGTKTSSQEIISKKSFFGNYIHYGVREHAMVAIMNGIKVHSGFIPYGGTFLVFSDYCRPAIRLAAIMKLPIILIFTHDSIGVGEDGPTHQPVEHLSSLRAIPNLNVFRPADATETTECWELILQQKERPSILCLSRQNLPQLRKAGAVNKGENMVKFGAYLLYQSPNQRHIVTIFATGSEVSLAMEVAKNLEEKEIFSRVISVPCQELFWDQPFEYQTAILHDDSLKVAIEAGIEQSWSKIIGPEGMFFGVEKFGQSAPMKDLNEHFGLITDKVVSRILKKILKNDEA
ncbi:transketolase [Candidatus Bandiella euplotis]|uniref:Transketolase n=1 Tax=Candidatus Bandiella euplotis TaxID=1664265 RepID=A0ABZ0ULX5_9RICK|nr:transketolase [Candidatus Bandiella woodruffii]WPX97134.1 Transketolase [Candidatus Bandiella woodruffii]